ncbi:DEAD/DEAH box helicase [Kallotenue papyrolyticum]|uniref:DEAD/DEAH box helicase n=1 Tax=Kallotenue papyrolyticum TaxID=1325125 RepID=UPI0004929203|nr:DEAD/DEAH box helicase [Kallotenue papyrolyticum]
MKNGSAAKPRRFWVPMEVEQTALDDLLDALEEAPDALLDATLHSAAPDDAPADEALQGGYRARCAFEPRPYQQAALERWLAHDGRGVVVLPTGAGKTVVALMAIARLKLRTLIVVPTIELLHQWRAALIERLGVAPRHVGIVGDGRKEWRPITVITYASAVLPQTALRDIGLLICDEAHHLPSPAYATIATRANAPYRLGLSATPERSDGLTERLYQLLGPPVYRRTPAELSAEGHIAAYVERRIFVSLSEEEALRYEALMGEWRWLIGSKRYALARGGDLFGELIRRAASDPRARRALQAHHQARMIALNAAAKLHEVERLLEQHRGDRVIVFSEYNALVDALAQRLALPAITYRTPAAERKAILDAFRQGRYSKLVTGRVLNEGVDVPDANVAIVVSGSSTTREYIQRLGRVLRPKDSTALLYEIITRQTSEVRAARKRRPASSDSEPST